MPLYDYICVDCDDEGEVFVPLGELRRDNTVDCPECGASAYRPPCAGTIVGVMPSKPFINDQTSAYCTTNEQKREWEKAQLDGGEIISKDSKQWRDHYDYARNLCDSRAKKRGYRDFEDQQAKKKLEAKKKRSLDSA